MARESAKTRRDMPGSKRKPSGAVIAAAVLVVAVGAGLLIIASMRPTPDVQSNGTAGTTPAVSDGRARQQSYEVINSYPHDPTSFTQGLLWRDGGFYESTGLNGQSKLRRLEFPSGKVLKETSLPAQLFGEGLALRDR